MYVCIVMYVLLCMSCYVCIPLNHLYEDLIKIHEITMVSSLFSRSLRPLLQHLASEPGATGATVAGVECPEDGAAGPLLGEENMVEAWENGDFRLVSH